MDIYSFINSKDIREYLKQIHYQFNSLETAWLIYACQKLSFEKKKEQWRKVITTMPDCEVPVRNNCAGWRSLHFFLRQYMDIMDREFAEFYQEKPQGEYVYMYSYLYEGDAGWTENYETIYPSLSKCLEAYKEDIDDLGATYCPDTTGVIKYRLKRQSLIHSGDVMEVECLGDGEMTDVLRNTWRKEEDEKIINESFAGLWFDFPTPFHKGDVIWIPSGSNDVMRECGSVFVLQGLSTWNSAGFFRESGDNSDMNGCGYFVNPNGSIDCETVGNYMDFEYYRGSYKLNERILPVLGEFLKGDIEIELLLRAYRKILLDVAAEAARLNDSYSREILQKIRLNGDNV